MKKKLLVAAMLATMPMAASQAGNITTDPINYANLQFGLNTQAIVMTIAYDAAGFALADGGEVYLQINLEDDVAAAVGRITDNPVGVEMTMTDGVNTVTGVVFRGGEDPSSLPDAEPGDSTDFIVVRFENSAAFGGAGVLMGGGATPMTFAITGMDIDSLVFLATPGANLRSRVQLFNDVDLSVEASGLDVEPFATSVDGVVMDIITTVLAVDTDVAANRTATLPDFTAFTGVGIDASATTASVGGIAVEFNGLFLDGVTEFVASPGVTGDTCTVTLTAGLPGALAGTTVTLTDDPAGGAGAYALAMTVDASGTSATDVLSVAECNALVDDDPADAGGATTTADAEGGPTDGYVVIDWAGAEIPATPLSMTFSFNGQVGYTDDEIISETVLPILRDAQTITFFNVPNSSSPDRAFLRVYNTSVEPGDCSATVIGPDGFTVGTGDLGPISGGEVRVFTVADSSEGAGDGLESVVGGTWSARARAQISCEITSMRGQGLIRREGSDVLTNMTATVGNDADTFGPVVAPVAP